MKIHWWWRNLGCQGFTIGQVYFDFFWSWGKWYKRHLRMFLSLKKHGIKCWFTIAPRPRLDQLEVMDRHIRLNGKQTWGE